MIFDGIREVYANLTKSQKLLADFVASSYHEASFMTASRLAQQLGLNEATVVRFAQRLGYAGYPELIRDVQAMVQRELRLRTEVREAGTDDGLWEVLQEEIESLRRLRSHMVPETVDMAIEMLDEAGTVIVLGQGVSSPLAELFSLELSSLGVSSTCPKTDPQALAIALANANVRSLIVAICVSRSEDLGAALGHARRQGARTLAITWSPMSPSAQAAELALSHPPYGSLSMPSIAPMTALLGAFVHLLAARRGSDPTQRLEVSSRTRS